MLRLGFLLFQNWDYFFLLYVAYTVLSQLIFNNTFLKDIT